MDSLNSATLLLNLCVWFALQLIYSNAGKPYCYCYVIFQALFNPVVQFKFKKGVVFIKLEENQVYTGRATWYESGQVTACGDIYASSDVLVAVSTQLWGSTTDPNVNHDPICKKKIIVAEVKNTTNKVVIPIQDKCGACAQGDLHLSIAAFEKFHPTSVGNLEVQWEFYNAKEHDSASALEIIADFSSNFIVYK